MTKALLKTRKLYVSIGGKSVCQQLDWTVNSGEIWGILGINGVGKTTLLYSLCGLHSPEQGDILLQDKPLTEYRANERAQQIGLLFQQHPDHFPVEIIEVCLHALHPDKARWQTYTPEDYQRVERVLEQVGLNDFQQRLTHTLSGGERQRLEIASLLLQNPKIRLLDEPVNHLDLKQQILMMELLIEQAKTQQGAVLTVLHDANMAWRFCSHVLLLCGKGQYLAGTTGQLLTEKQLGQLYDYPIVSLDDKGRKAFVAD